MPRITELYAYVTYDADEGDEGVPAFAGPDGALLPMMGADMERAESLKALAQETANMLGKPIKLVRSTGLEVVEVLKPHKRAADLAAVLAAGLDDAPGESDVHAP